MEQLIPHHWFLQATPLLLTIYTVGGLYFLRLGAEWLVEGASGTAFRLGMPEVIIGATIISLGTTTPEAAVSVLAALDGNARLALGNSIGSVVTNTSLILGIGLLMSRLPADRFLMPRQGWVQGAAAVTLALLCYGSWALRGEAASLGLITGIILLSMLLVYLVLSIRWAKQHPQDLPVRVSENIVEHAEAGERVHLADDHVTRKPMLQLIGLTLGGLIVILVSGHVTVEAVSVGAQRLGIPPIVIAATLVSLGTSLPELVVGLTAIRRGHPELLMGNILGANILNILFVLGAASLAAPLPILDQTAKLPQLFLSIHIPALLAVITYLSICLFFAVKKSYFERWTGIPLLVMYAVYLISQFVASV